MSARWMPARIDDGRWMPAGVRLDDDEAEDFDDAADTDDDLDLDDDSDEESPSGDDDDDDDDDREELSVRAEQNETIYLRAVRRWFGKMDP